MKQSVTIYKHGGVYFVGVDTWSASSPGVSDTTIWELVSSPSDERLGRVVLARLGAVGGAGAGGSVGSGAWDI